MKKQFALTQVCVVELSRSEIESILRDHLKAFGGNPSYDFAANRPIFVWEDTGGVSVRYVQAAVFAKERESFMQLNPVPTEQEMLEIIKKRAEGSKA